MEGRLDNKKRWKFESQMALTSLSVRWSLALLFVCVTGCRVAVFLYTRASSSSYCIVLVVPSTDATLESHHHNQNLLLHHNIIQLYNGNPLTCKPSIRDSTHTQMILHTPWSQCVVAFFVILSVKMRNQAHYSFDAEQFTAFISTQLFIQSERRKLFCVHVLSLLCYPHAMYTSVLWIEFHIGCVCVSKYRSVCVLCIRFLSCWLDKCLCCVMAVLIIPNGLGFVL